MKNEKARKYNSDILNDLLSEITPEENFEIETKMVLAARIGDLIKEKRWSKGEFATKVNVNPSEVSKWLSGTHNFTTSVLCKIAFALGTDVANLHVLPKPQMITTESKYYVPDNKDTQLPVEFSWNPDEYGILPLNLEHGVISDYAYDHNYDMLNLLHFDQGQCGAYLMAGIEKPVHKTTYGHKSLFKVSNKKLQTT